MEIQTFNVKITSIAGNIACSDVRASLTNSLPFESHVQEIDVTYGD